MNEFQAILKKEHMLRDVYGINFLDLKVLVSISGSYEWHEWKVLRRSTGFRGKNGKKIYEGDVVEHQNPRKRGVVTFGKHENSMGSYFGWYIERILKIGKQKKESIIDFGSCSAIGNIYQNPELLK